jgi:HSP20 family protein
MPLRPDPLKEMLDLQERLNRLFDETLGREQVEDPARHAAWMPVADVLETADAYVVEIELPGVGPEDFTVHAEGTDLVIRGERRLAAASRPEAFHRIERRHGPFARGFRLPQDVDAEAVSARLTDGVLKLVLPKARRTSRVRVERA